ncbi:uncharacterized protein LOC115456380 [Manduca sexta]|uniref:Seminal fluid protein n=1 Tax=Manduca sexta TaxID=7130 RepID=A0A921YRJ0_MANSE|nr:uncharacterized protein LOC115456380 [Manduca sexta]KAG6444083.1 hypothetical protein O3G_MSEX003216 [Manduca sexta]KAG6444084.1 hypothetical protein O3G_MSEX003216 [Manduca sexta]
MASFRTLVVLMMYFSISLTSPAEHSGILSRLYKQAAKQNRPLIIVLDNSAHGKAKDVKHKTSMEVEKPVPLPFMYMYQPDQHEKKSQLAKLPISKLLEKEDKAEKSSIKKLPKHHQLKNADDKRYLRSPVIKSLLRISNSLRCEAKDECEDKCNNRYTGRQRDECEDECEIKYSCEESEEDPCEEKDECEESHDSCEQHDISTRGERLITVTPKCKRC